MTDKKYSFKNISGMLDKDIAITLSCPIDAEPIGVDFVYFDKDGVAWRVVTQGWRTKTGEVR